MKYLLEVNARTDASETAELKHEKIMDGICQLDIPWGIPNKVKFPGFGDHFVATVNLQKYLPKGVVFNLFYRYRNMLSDDSSCDDRIYIEFNDKKINYSYLIDTVLPTYIHSLNAYSASIFPEKLIFLDFDSSRGMNLRNTIIRFYPVMFMDDGLCKRALKMSSKDLHQRIRNDVDKLELINNGIYIIAKSKPATVEECLEIDKRIREIIGI